MGKLAITGITGKSGLFLWKEIVSNEDKIRQVFPDGVNLISRELNRLDNFKLLKLPVYKYSGNLLDERVDLKFCDGCDTLLHIAGIHWSLPLVKSAIEKGIKRLILIHTTGIYSKYKAAGDEYRQIDAEIYKLAKENSINLTILRPTMIYGDISDRNVIVFITMVDRLKIMPTVNGAHYELQPVHCEDLGKAYYRVLLNPEICNNKDYVLSGGEPIELRSMFDEIAKNLGVRRKYINCPFILAYIGAWFIFILSLGKKDYREKVQRLVEPRVYSHEEATKDFGYSPMTFKEGVVDEVKQYIKVMKEKK